MKYQCKVCGQKFPFPSDLATHETFYSEEKKFKYSYPNCSKSYKTKAKYNCHYNYRHEQKLAKQQEIKCSICDKILSKVKYLKEHQKSHLEDFPFGCNCCGQCFKWRSSHKNHIDMEHKKESE